VNECASGNPCGQYGSCSNTTGWYSCTCTTGYGFDGMSCVDIDECASGGRCYPGTCTNTQGSYSCTCPAGYYDGGGSCCEDAATMCAAYGCNATPTNSCGAAFDCTCGTDYYCDIDGITCTPIDPGGGCKPPLRECPNGGCARYCPGF
jgi:EGF domain-containing protein